REEGHVGLRRPTTQRIRNREGRLHRDSAPRLRRRRLLRRGPKDRVGRLLIDDGDGGLDRGGTIRPHKRRAKGRAARKGGARTRARARKTIPAGSLTGKKPETLTESVRSSKGLDGVVVGETR